MVKPQISSFKSHLTKYQQPLLLALVGAVLAGTFIVYEVRVLSYSFNCPQAFEGGCNVPIIKYSQDFMFIDILGCLLLLMAGIKAYILSGHKRTILIGLGIIVLLIAFEIIKTNLNL